MEVLVNELSLNRQFSSIEDFVTNGLNIMLPVLKGFSDDVSICKTHNFFQCEVSNGITIHSILVADYSRTIDEIRRYKLFYSKFFQNPYWEDNSYHSLADFYSYNNQNVTGTSIAEACMREQILLSFNNGGFNIKLLEITKENYTFKVVNLRTKSDLEDLLSDIETILNNVNRFTRTNLVRQGKLVFQEIESGNYWYLDNLHKDHYEVFCVNKNHLGTANLDGILDVTKCKNGRRL